MKNSGFNFDLFKLETYLELIQFLSILIFIY